MDTLTKLFVALSLLSAPAATGQYEEIVVGEVGAQLDAVFEAAETDGFAGAILIVREGEILLQKGYGLANRETETPWTPATISTVGSITKTFTAAAVLKLASEGKLSVDDPITMYFEDVPPDKQHITLHHLLTHSAGLKAAHGGDFDKNATREVVLERAMEADLLWSADKAGENYEYSNTGYSLLAMIVEDLSGMPYEAYLRETIFEPAGMVDTGYTLDWDETRMAHGYSNDRDTGVVALKHVLPDGPAWTLRGNGGLHSTVVDLHRFHRALRDGKIIPREWFEKMIAKQVREVPGEPYFYGYGLARTVIEEGDVYGHNGSNNVFYADLRRYMEHDVTVISMSNVAEHMSHRSNPKIRAVLFGPPGERVNVDTVVDTGIWPALTGPYAVGVCTLVVATGREEPYTVEEADQRVLMVEVWYPASQKGDEVRRYFPADAATREQLQAHIGLKNLGEAFASFYTNAYRGAPIAADKGPFPVVIVSHGYTDTRHNNTALCEDLASHGYVVIALDHPYSAAIVRYPDGRQVGFDPRFPDGDSKREDRPRTFEVWVADLRSVVDAVASGDAVFGDLGGWMDAERIGVMGHSFGGAAAAELCRTDGRITAVVNLDGGLQREVLHEGVNNPVMTLTQVAPESGAGSMDAFNHHRRVNGFLRAAGERRDSPVYAIAAMAHMNFCDWPLLAQMVGHSPAEPIGAMDARRGSLIMNELVAAFFNEHLQGGDSTVGKVAGAMPEVTLIGNASGE